MCPPHSRDSQLYDLRRHNHAAGDGTGADIGLRYSKVGQAEPFFLEPPLIMLPLGASAVTLGLGFF